MLSCKVMSEHTLHVPTAESLSQSVGIKWNHRCSSKQLPMYDVHQLVTVSSLVLALPRHATSELVPSVGPM